MTYRLNRGWTLLTWTGKDGTPPGEALSRPGGETITAIYTWMPPGRWLAYFPNGVGVPGANDLEELRSGNAYWIASRSDGTDWSVPGDAGEEPR